MTGRIRRGEVGDLAGLVRLVAECFERPWSEPSLAGALAAPSSRLWVFPFDPADVGDGTGADPTRLQGFVLARRGVDALEIDLVGVAPSARRSGIARRLLAVALEAAVGEGVREAQLELSSANRGALALYEALGFVVVGRRPRYYPDGSDALLMSRPLAPSGA